MRAGFAWTEDEDEILRRTTDLTLREVSELLPGRTAGATQKRRLRIGVEGESPWTQEEDETLRRMTHLTFREMVELLPGRTVGATKKRCERIGIKSRSPWTDDSPWRVGSRTLLAKTCSTCGLVLDATWFHWKEPRAGHPGHWSNKCRKCYNPLERSHGREGGTAAGARASYRRLQELTVDRAHRSGQPWTESDERILDDPELTVLEKALRTERTYAATRQHCTLRGYTSKVGLGDAVAGQWRIDNPNLP